MSSPTRFTLLVVPLVVVLLSSGCAKRDDRLEKISAGISKDSVLVLMAVEKPKRVDPFLINGQYIEAMYFPMLGATDSASVTDRKMSPVVLQDGKVVVWGWKQWDSMATDKKITVPEK